ncbi:RDD family protein [Terribacillus saccharophilus]|uniref:RDD family protein n=1 Tax=Terribacillus saccharophilus TaxID=361277 RepID=UPI002DC39461|nr:RDD family protein [Terribacillus saccharophilus]
MDKEKREHPEELTSSDQDYSRTEIPETTETDEQTASENASDAYENTYQENRVADEELKDHRQEEIPLSPLTGEQRYAGFWMRFWAYIVDLIVVFSLTGLIVKPFTMIDSFREATLWLWSVSGLLGGVIFFAYFLLMTKWRGQTLGKMIFGLRVIRKDGERLSWSDTLIREVVGRFIHRLLFLFFLYAVVAFTPKKQGLHDMFADTLVIHE